MLSKKELIYIVGGINITASFISAISRGINSVLGLGRSFGSALRRIIDGRLCSY